MPHNETPDPKVHRMLDAARPVLKLELHNEGCTADSDDMCKALQQLQDAVHALDRGDAKPRGIWPR